MPFATIALLACATGIAATPMQHDIEMERLFKAGHYSEAAHQARAALELREQSLAADDPVLAKNVNNLAILLKMSGDYAAAFPLYERAIRIRERTLGPGHIEVARSKLNLSSLARVTGDLVRSRELCDESLALAESATGPDHPTLVEFLNGLALVQERQNELLQARASYERSLAILDKAEPVDESMRARIAVNLGALLYQLGEYPEARERMQQGVSLREVVVGPEHPAYAEALNNLAGLEGHLGNYTAARRLYEQSLAIYEAVSDGMMVATVGQNLAGIMRTQGDFAAARARFERSLAILEQVKGPEHPDVAIVLSNLAVVHATSGEPDLAMPLYKRSASIMEKSLGPRHPRLAGTLFAQAALLRTTGDLVRAMQLYSRVLEIREASLDPGHPDIAGTLDAMGRVHRGMGDLDRGRELHERALAINEEAFGPEHPVVASSLANLADAYRQLGLAEESRRLWRRGLAIHEARLELVDALSEREAIAYLGTVRLYLDVWLDNFDRLEDAADSWSAVLRWKGLVTRRVGGRAAVGPVADDLAGVRSEMASLAWAPYGPGEAEQRSARLAELTDRKEDLERQLAGTHDSWRGGTKVHTATELCQALPPGTALVDYLRVDEHAHPRYLAFATVSPECRVTRVELPDAEAVDEAIRAWRQVLPVASPSRVRGRGRRVTAALWEPVQGVLSSAERLIVVPDGPISAVPFGALPLDEHTFLIERYPIQVLSDALQIIRPHGPSGTGLLAVGGVDFGPARGEEGALCARNYGPLPATRLEADRIAEHWVQSQHRRETAIVLGGSDATEVDVSAAMSGTRLIHVASHGFFATSTCRELMTAERNPLLLSGLVLAGANERSDERRDDGLLTAEEVSLLDLRGTQLVVLSACETGLGEVTSGQGVLGLQRAFASAGAQNLVMSLWSVPDAATERLMDAFYGRLLRKRRPLPVPEALREAQLDLLRDSRDDWGHGDPGTWAAFVAGGPA